MLAIFLLVVVATSSVNSYTFNYGTSTFGATLKSEHEDGDLYQIITGDTQIYFGCTSDNKECRAATCTDGNDDDCADLQATWSNQAQAASIVALAQLIKRRTGQKVSGVVMNGDITQDSSLDNCDVFDSWWTDEITDEAGVPFYPGLGNHDYQTHVTSDPDDVVDLLSWHYKYLQDNQETLGISNIDVSTSGSTNTGSIAYSWDHCDGQSDETCYHFVQLQNYPFYEVDVTASSGTEWSIKESLDWFEADLEANKDKPIIVNFHSPSPNTRTEGTEIMEETGFKTAKWNSFLNTLADYDVQGVFFAHWHTQTGVCRTKCLGDNSVNFIYSGSVPGGNYVLIRLRGGKIENSYTLHVNGDEETTIADEELDTTACDA